MKILVVTMAEGDYVKGAELLLNSLRNHGAPNVHFTVWTPSDELDYLSFMNEHHRGTLLSIRRMTAFKAFEGYDRIILMDADMIAVDDISLLFSEELNTKDYWACQDLGCRYYYKDRLNVDPEKIINGGLQVINKPLLNKAFFDKLVSVLVKGESFDGSDQGYLSLALPRLGIDIGWLPLEYNYCFQDSYYPKLENPRIKHYTGRKPWQ